MFEPKTIRITRVEVFHLDDPEEGPAELEAAVKAADELEQSKRLHSKSIAAIGDNGEISVTREELKKHAAQKAKEAQQPVADKGQVG